MDNKEYIINIRVSKEVYDKLKNRAQENGESLSNLVRKTLSDSWEIFDDLKKDLFGQDKKTDKDNIEHYTKVIVAKDVFCDRCKASISKGEQVIFGETKTGIKKYICSNCFL